MRIKSVTVFCGASSGSKEEYISAAEDMGRILAENNVRLVYGGGGVGLMGILAKAVMKYGGNVTGIIPKFLLDKEGYKALSDLRVVDSIGERKEMMGKLADAFIAMPGGLGTLNEIFEVLLFLQLKIHSKPCGFLNISNYYVEIFNFLHHAMEHDFIIRDCCRHLLCIDTDPLSLLKSLDSKSLPNPTEKNKPTVMVHKQ